MIYLIATLIVALVVFILLNILHVSRRNVYKSNYFEYDMDRGVREFGIGFRSVEPIGGRIDMASIRHTIIGTIRFIKTNYKKGIFINSGEKWLIDNERAILTQLDLINNNTFIMLPHNRHGIRIIRLAEFILGHTKTLDEDTIYSIINRFDAVTELEEREIASLSDAFRYTLLSKLSHILKKIKSNIKIELSAMRSINFDNTEGDNATYLYYYSKYHNDDNILPCMYDSIVNYEKSLEEISSDVENIIISLRRLNDVFCAQKALKLSKINKMLSSNNVYRLSDDVSKFEYINAVEQLSKQCKVSNKDVVNALFGLEKIYNTHFGVFLFEDIRMTKRYLKKRKLPKFKNSIDNVRTKLYVLSIIIITSILDAVFMYFVYDNPFSLMLLLPSYIILFRLVQYIVGKVANYLVPKKKIIKYNKSKIDSKDRVTIIVSEYIEKIEDVTPIAEKINALYAVHSSDNISVTLLIDLGAKDSEWDNIDEAILTSIKEQVVNGVNILLRNRMLTKGRYIGWERKRGAIMDAVSFFVKGERKAFRYIRCDIEYVKYAILLDSDSEILPSTVLDAVNTISHPMNAKYDIMTMNSRYNLYSISSIYSTKYLFSSGIEKYNNYSDLIYNISDYAIYQGKGIIDMARYLTKLDNVVPENAVLSHDILEGAITSTGALDCYVYEDAPVDFRSECLRNNRWLKGDILLLPFARNSQKSADNMRITTKKPLIYKYIMYSNALAPLYRASMLLFILLSIIDIRYLMLGIFGVAVYLIDNAYSTIYSLIGIGKNKKIKSVIAQISYCLYDGLEKILLLPFFVLKDIRIFIDIIISKILNTDIFNWTTFASCQQSYSLAKHLAFVMDYLIISLITMILALIYSKLTLFWYFCTSILLVLIMYFGCYRTKKRVIAKSYFEDVAKKISRYFLSYSSKMLIPDNVEFISNNGDAEYTSPTNIGFSLLAYIASYHLGVISLDEATDGIYNIINIIDGLDKYNGNLYNWYSVLTNDPLPPRFVSSVDNGNFLAALIVVKEFLIDFSCDYTIVDRIINDMDFDIFYIKDKGIFAIGYDSEYDKLVGNYDMLASEARLFNYIACLKTGHYNAYQSLNRDFTWQGGDVLLSWSGTMFEYLMPSLFIDDPQYSLMSNTLNRVVKCQQSHAVQGIWGFSESGYAELNNEKKYLYHAFGINELSERNEQDEAVISPYSSMLAIEYSAKSVRNNLAELTRLGVFGDYGFYEAIDLRNGNNIVYSYMAHHQGMAIVSLVNYLYDDIFKKYFMSNDLIKGGRILLTEREMDTKMGRNIHGAVATEIGEFSSRRVADGANNMVNLLTNGRMNLYTDELGNNYQYIDNRYIGCYGGSYLRQFGMMFYIDEEGDRYSPQIIANSNVELNNFETLFTEHYSEYKDVKHAVSLRIETPGLINGLKATLTLKNSGNSSRHFNITMIEKIMLSDIDSHLAHPMFSDMFMDTELIEGDSIMIARKKQMHSFSSYYAACFAVGLDNVKCETNLRNVLSRYSESINSFSVADSKDNISFGDVLVPCFVLCGDVEVAPNSEVSIDFFIIANHEKRQLIDEIMSLKHKNSILGMLTVTSNEIYKYLDNSYDYEFMCDLAATILNGRSHSVRKDNKKVVAYIGSDSDINYKKLLSMHRYINNMGIAFDLICISDNSNNHGYYLTLDTLKIDKCTITKHVGYRYPKARYIRVNTPRLISTNKYGGFDESGDFYVTNHTAMPYSNVVGSVYGGFIESENGTVYSFGTNSREEKITEWKNESLMDIPSERIYLVKDSLVSRINCGYDSGYTRHSLGFSEHINHVSHVDTIVKRCLIDDGKIQVVKITLSNKGSSCDTELLFEYDIALGVNGTDDISIDRLSLDTIRVTNNMNGTMLYFRCSHPIDIKGGLRDRYDSIGTVKSYGNDDKGVALSVNLHLNNDENIITYMVFSTSIDAVNNITFDRIEERILAGLNTYSNANPWHMMSNDKMLDILFNHWLYYEVMSCRFNARTSFYQAGGAIGYRDQLQDSLTLMYGNAGIAREHILDACRHQYVEGDVMHWWHPPYFGVRTRITDDRLFLVFAVDEYIKITGDKSILDISVPFITSDRLDITEKSRLENAAISQISSSVLEHMKRAIDVSCRFGDNGLVLIGSGDWNDALDGIGIDGKGESVWLSMLLYDVLMRMTKYVDKEKALEYKTVIEKLKLAIDATYDVDRYKRARTDEGEWLGARDSRVCALDILTQAFSVLSGAGTKKKSLRALSTALQLVDKDNGIIKLLSPPFDMDKYYGYISLYPEGIRENGGQYTHASIWYIMALHKAGKRNEAKELFDLICPIKKFENAEKASRYKVEPYVMAADVYSAKGYEGQGGWTWYTGSASWTYLYMLTMMYGIRIEDEYFVIDKKKGDCIKTCIAKYRDNGVMYDICIEEKGVSKLLIDGVNVEYTNRIKIARDNVLHKIEYYY